VEKALRGRKGEEPRPPKKNNVGKSWDMGEGGKRGRRKGGAAKKGRGSAFIVDTVFLQWEMSSIQDSSGVCIQGRGVGGGKTLAGGGEMVVRFNISLKWVFLFGGGWVGIEGRNRGSELGLEFASKRVSISQKGIACVAEKVYP